MPAVFDRLLRHAHVDRELRRRVLRLLPGLLVFLSPLVLSSPSSALTLPDYVTRLSVSDGEVSAAVLDRRVGSGNDDAEEAAPGGVSLNSSDLELVFDSTNQKVGLRFTNMAIPPRAAITRAYVQFETDETQSEATNLLIEGQAADNAATFGTAKSGISSRPRTAASVRWSPPAWTLVGEAGTNQRSPELAGVIQEIVNRAGWTSGNALALLITGTGHRTASAFEGKAAGAALLHIEYGSGSPRAPSNTAPPTISGSAQEGQTLRADPGSWNGTAPISYGYQWRRCDSAGANCTDIVPGSDLTYMVAAADVGRTLRVVATGSNGVGSGTATSAQTSVVAAAGTADPVIAAAGDICSSATNCDPTARLVEQINPTRALTLGDNAYEDGSPSQFASYYEPNWGRFKAKTSPTPGNHDYHLPGASGYYGYFGALAPAEYYSYDIGSWHLIALNSEISVSSSSAQLNWVRSDLAAHPNRCTLAYWHKPRFSSGTVHGGSASFDPFWQALHAAGAEIVLVGHEHNYERFGKQSPTGAPDPNGIRQFVVGTGGAGQGYSFGSPVANSQTRNDTTFGVLKLTLHGSSYDWEFIPVAGSTFTDSGSDSCH